MPQTGPAAAQLGLCTQWATPADVCEPCNVEGFDINHLDRWLEVASYNLYLLTGSQWAGECTDTVYPEAQPCIAPLGRRWRWGMPTRQRRGLPRELRLPGTPVRLVEEVVIDGQVVDPARYRVDDGRWLVWLPEDVPGAARGWPTTQDVLGAVGAEGVWSVTYVYGAMPPPGGREAAAVLGCQLALSCNPNADAGDCRLPERVVAISRQGVSMTVFDPATLFPDGLTGLTEVDSWVAAQRLGVARRPATVWVPGSRPAVRRRTTTPLP